MSALRGHLYDLVEEATNNAFAQCRPSVTSDAQVANREFCLKYAGGADALERLIDELTPGEEPPSA